MRVLLSILVNTLLVIPLVDASVLFSELMANPTGKDDGREWIEFYVINETNLTGWGLHESGTDHRLSLVQGNETVQPGLYFIVADDVDAFVNETGFNGTLFDSSFSLSNSGETLVLKNSTHTINLTYDQPPEGKSLCYVNDTWAVCEPTPGEANRPYVEQSEQKNESNTSVTPLQNQTAGVREENDDSTMRVVSYPKKLAFGSDSQLVVVANIEERAYVYAYGYPKRVLVDNEGRGLSAGDFDGDASVVVESSGYVFVPIRTHANCDDRYESGVYRIRVRIAGEYGDELETEDIFLELDGKEGCREEEIENERRREKEIPSERAEKSKDVEDKKGETPRVYIVDAPRNATLGENVTLRTVVIGNGTFEIYSYVREGKRLASTGGWMGNRRTLDVRGVGYAELQNTVTRAGNLTIVVRALSGNETYEATRSLSVSEKTDITLTSENNSLGTQNKTQSVVNVERKRVQEKKNLWDSFIEILRRWLG